MGFDVYPRRIATVTCRRCGATAECAGGTAPLTWSSVTTAPDAPPDLVCERCTRDNVRAIEGKLDEDWW